MIDKGESEITGMSRNIASLFSYFLFFISGIILLLIEKDKFVRFHAVQSILFSVIFGILLYAFSNSYFFFPMILFHWLVLIGGIVLWITLMLKAYNHEEWKLPVLGHLASKIVNRMQE